ncbi:DUF1996 domain-containing protein [Altererythrobacter aurantiacus]|uniref:DUF1996 domain-containing protein n=1 Tax=Parapontixanthobacter aurantiacus TaxID=1463599 RepID=A0A844ZGZ3_9SPHN|nr:DUF1996 domain-containing protein [Parapontixanthobacter aurantiacus]MXO87048.1 DUF1996 domain-containing protein [Parapontixanthobacter aurantiacus]
MRNVMRLAYLPALMAIAGCVPEDGTEDLLTVPEPVAVETTPEETPAPAPAPTPTPTQSPTGIKNEKGYVELDPIATNFDRSEWIGGRSLPDSSAPDVVGAFRFICRPSHNAYDDPIVFPGQKGAAHLHTFFGNTMTDANSTYESLRTTGDSTCNNALNRSAYWMPALMNGRGQVVMPDAISIYYKRRPASDPACQEGKGCVPVPRGLRYVFGRTMSGPGPGDHVYFKCMNVDGKYDSLPEAARNCPSGRQIGAVVASPQCWNGTELDSADHRSHMAYMQRDRNTGQQACPSTHPYTLPQFTMGVWYTTDDTLDRSGDLSTSRQTWYFASDRMEGKTWLPSGHTFHADWFGAWDDDVLKTWNDNCIDKLLNCAGGDLGNGTGLRLNEISRERDNNLVDVPPRT